MIVHELGQMLATQPGRGNHAVDAVAQRLLQDLTDVALLVQREEQDAHVAGIEVPRDLREDLRII